MNNYGTKERTQEKSARRLRRSTAALCAARTKKKNTFNPLTLRSYGVAGIQHSIPDAGPNRLGDGKTHWSTIKHDRGASNYFTERKTLNLELRTSNFEQGNRTRFDTSGHVRTPPSLGSFGAAGTYRHIELFS